MTDVHTRPGYGLRIVDRRDELSTWGHVARRAACTRLRVVTTNDDLDALRFYQRRGFRLARLRPGAVTRSRQTLKPAIPTTGPYGIDLRDEVELEMDLGHVAKD
jgi:hypothetical protein